MRSLFLKLFLWFWLTAIASGIVLAASIAYAMTRAQFQVRTIAADLLPAVAESGAREFERGGEPQLERYLADVEQEYPVFTYFFDSEGQELNERQPVTAGVRTATTIAAHSDQLYIIPGDGAAQRANGPSGKRYVLAVLFDPLSPRAPGVGLARAAKVTTLLTPVVTFFVGGLFCFLITRHITKPLFQLRGVAAQIANGELQARITPLIGRRRDEIGVLARDFDTMAQRLETLVAGQKRMLGDVSHELRSPLARLLVALGLAKKTAIPETVEHLDRIALEGHRLDILIGQLLTLSRIDASTTAAPADSIDLAALVHEVANDADFEARAHSKNVRMTSIDECTITGSEELLRSALENVIRNGVRFTREGTSVEISLSRQASTAVLRIRDHGPGVPERMLNEIFLPFRRVSKSDEEQAEGAGLGLAIARRAVEANGGTVRAMNAADGGLIVEVVLRS